MSTPTEERRANVSAEIKEPWLAALRSGEFKQAQGSLVRGLRDGQGNPTGQLGYCCLGVLCVAMGWELRDEIGGAFTGISSGPPQLIGPYNDSGLTDDNRAYLAQLNDSGRTFAEIADVIEREF